MKCVWPGVSTWNKTRNCGVIKNIGQVFLNKFIFIFIFGLWIARGKKNNPKAGACFHFISGTSSVKSHFSFLISWPLSMTSDWGYQRSVWLAHCASADDPFGQPSLTFNLWGYHVERERERETETERSKGRSTYVITSPPAAPEGSGNQHTIRADTIVHWNTVLAPRSSHEGCWILDGLWEVTETISWLRKRLEHIMLRPNASLKKKKIKQSYLTSVELSLLTSNFTFNLFYLGCL